VSIQPVNLWYCFFSTDVPVTRPPFDLVSSTSVVQPLESVTAAHGGGNTRVLAVSLSVSIALLICLVIFVRTLFNFVFKNKFNVNTSFKFVTSENVDSEFTCYKTKPFKLCLPLVSLTERNCYATVRQGVILLRRLHHRKNIKSMNFDNPVYRKTTADEESLSIDRQQYQPVYPSVHIPQNQSPVSCLITFLSLTSGRKFVLLTLCGGKHSSCLSILHNS